MVDNAPEPEVGGGRSAVEAHDRGGSNRILPP